MEMELIVGNNRAGVNDGSKITARGGRIGELIVGLAVADYWTALARSQIFEASTAAAGVAPGTALSTTPPFVLYNPLNSGVIAVPLDVEVGFVSGTLGAGNVVLAGIANQNITSLGTNLNAASTLLGIGVGPTCKALQAPTLSAAPTLIRNLFYTGAFVTNATQYFGEAKKDLKGVRGVGPGGALCVQEVGGAGTTPLVMISMTWIEVPIVFNP